MKKENIIKSNELSVPKNLDSNLKSNDYDNVNECDAYLETQKDGRKLSKA